MNTFFIKIIFLIFTLIMFLYISSFAKYEITKNNNILGGIFVFIFTVASVIFGNIMFFIT